MHPGLREPSAWRAVAAATALNAPLGSIYAFSVFLKPLESLLGLSRADLAFVFALAAAVFAAGMGLAAPDDHVKTLRRFREAVGLD